MKNNEAVIGIIAAVVGLFLISIFTAPMLGYTRYGYGMMSYGFGSMWLFGWLFMVLVIVALVLLIMWLVKQLQNPNNQGRSKRR